MLPGEKLWWVMAIHFVKSSRSGSARWNLLVVEDGMSSSSSCPGRAVHVHAVRDCMLLSARHGVGRGYPYHRKLFI